MDLKVEAPQFLGNICAVVAMPATDAVMTPLASFCQVRMVTSQGCLNLELHCDMVCGSVTLCVQKRVWNLKLWPERVSQRFGIMTGSGQGQKGLHEGF